MRALYYLIAAGGLTLTACSDFQPAKTAEIGGFQLQVQNDPALAVGKSSNVTLSIRDGINQAVADCNVRFRQFMPGHQMSLDDTYVVMEDEAKVGNYLGHSGEFSMGGDWVLEFSFVCGPDSHQQTFDYHLEWPE